MTLFVIIGNYSNLECNLICNTIEHYYFASSVYFHKY